MIVYIITTVIMVSILLTIRIRAHHRICRILKTLEEQTEKVNFWRAEAIRQETRVNGFKKTALKLTDKNIVLERALERATIHQPPPTTGE